MPAGQGRGRGRPPVRTCQEGALCPSPRAQRRKQTTMSGAAAGPRAWRWRPAPEGLSASRAPLQIGAGRGRSHHAPRRGNGFHRGEGEADGRSRGRGGDAFISRAASPLRRASGWRAIPRRHSASAVLTSSRSPPTSGRATSPTPSARTRLIHEASRRRADGPDREHQHRGRFDLRAHARGASARPRAVLLPAQGAGARRAARCSPPAIRSACATRRAIISRWARASASISAPSMWCICARIRPST